MTMVYKSADKRFGLDINANCIDSILTYVQKSGNKETGGILIGSYSKQRDIAIVSKITGPPNDSRSGRTWFTRGTRGLQLLLNKYWQTNQYYLGEWHFHPNASPNPSFCDKTQMIQIATSRQYTCPEPLLLIIGGSVMNYSIRTFVVVGSKELIELKFDDVENDT